MSTPRSSKGQEAIDLAGLVVWPKVEVKAVLARLGLLDPNEEQPRSTVGRWSNLELLRVVVHDLPGERLPPPTLPGSLDHGRRQLSVPIRGSWAALYVESTTRISIGDLTSRPFGAAARKRRQRIPSRALSTQLTGHPINAV